MKYPTQHTPGPWCWRQLGNTPALCTQHNGCLIVMDFARSGMQNAVARMSDRRDTLGGIMHKMTLRDLDCHPDARLIRAAPELLAAAEAVLAAGDWSPEFGPIQTLREAVESARLCDAAECSQGENK